MDTFKIKKLLIKEYERAGGSDLTEFIRGMTWFESFIGDLRPALGSLNNDVPDNMVVRGLEHRLKIKTEQLKAVTKKFTAYKQLPDKDKIRLRREREYEQLMSELIRVKQENQFLKKKINQLKA